MSVEDPKETLKALIRENITLFKDDGTTPASILVADEFNEDFWRKYDVIITVSLQTQHDKLLNLSSTYKETVSVYRISVWTRSRTDINGQSMRWKAVQEINRIINENMRNPGEAINWMKLTGRNDSDKTDVKPVLYCSTMYVETHSYENM